MKIHDLHPAPGSVTKRTRVGRGIAAGKGKTAGRGTKGQKSRAGASIPAWFDRGFRNINDIEYDVVNVGAISAAIDAGKLEVQKGAPVTVNTDTLKQAGLVRRDRLPLKVLGNGDVSAKLFVLADAFTRSAREKIEAAGGTVQVIEIPTSPLAALGVDVPADVEAPAKPARAPRGSKASAKAATAKAETAEAEETATDDEPVAAKSPAGRKAAAVAADEPAAADDEPVAEAAAPEDAADTGTPAEADEADAVDEG